MRACVPPASQRLHRQGPDATTAALVRARFATACSPSDSPRSRSRGKRVLLKPNLVEPSRDCPHMTTHPAMIVAAAEVFRGWGADVTVGEGPGHVRDTEMALVESGVADALDARAAAVRRSQLPRGRLDRQSRPGQQAAGLLLPAGGRRGRPDRLAAEDEDASLGRRHRGDEEPVRHDPRHQVRLAEERAAPQRHSRDGLRHQRLAAARRSPSSTASTAWKGTARSWGRRKHDGPRRHRHQPRRRRCHGLPPDGRRSRAGPVPRDSPPTASARSTTALIDQRGEAWQPLARPFTILDKPHLKDLVRHRGVLVS